MKIFFLKSPSNAVDSSNSVLSTASCQNQSGVRATCRYDLLYFFYGSNQYDKALSFCCSSQNDDAKLFTLKAIFFVHHK